MITNLNVRVCNENNAIFLQFQEDGRAKEAAFPDWTSFLNWLAEKVHKK